MKVAYLTWHDPCDVRHWSGSHAFMFQALEQRVELTAIGPFHSPAYYRALELLLNAWHAGPAKRQPHKYRLGFSLFAAAAYSSVARRRIAASGCDLVFAPTAAREAVFSCGHRPFVYFNDAIFPQVAANYARFSNYARLTYWEAERVERLCVQRAALSVFSSQWAVDAARSRYQLPPGKVQVAAFGANLHGIPAQIPPRGPLGSHCRLLLVGKDWQRKGVDLAVAAVEKIRARGHEVTLTVLGCKTPPGQAYPWLEIIPWLSKVEADGHSAYADLLSRSDIFILPTRADCTPVVLNEAAAFSLPVLTSNIGGIRDLMEDGVTGYLHSAEATAEDYAASIGRILETPGLYEKLSAASRQLYDKRLNWDVWGDRMKGLFDGILS